MAISFISTVLFNGNPLLKFDGYFILMDYLKIPNLASKSFGYIKYLFLNGALGISLIPNTAADSRESIIFSVYGISAIIYRFFLYFGIIATVYYRFDKTIGILLAVLAIGLFLVRPLMRGFIMIYKQKSEIRFRPVGLVCCLLLLI